MKLLPNINKSVPEAADPGADQAGIGRARSAGRGAGGGT